MVYSILLPRTKTYIVRTTPKQVVVDIEAGGDVVELWRLVESVIIRVVTGISVCRIGFGRIILFGYILIHSSRLSQ